MLWFIVTVALVVAFVYYLRSLKREAEDLRNPLGEKSEAVVPPPPVVTDGVDSGGTGGVKPLGVDSGGTGKKSRAKKTV